MAKLKLQRVSETPVDPNESKMFSDEFAAAYDKAEIKAKAKAQNPQQVMLKMQRYCRYIEHNLRKKYKLHQEVEMPTSKKGWAQLLKQFNGSPIMLASTMRNENEIVGVIVDGPLN